MPKLTSIVVGIVTLLAVSVVAQSVTNLPAGNTNAPPTVAEPEEAEWSFGVSVYGYFVPDDRDYAQPTITLDHGWLHLEARYNDENLETGSLWVGYNFGGGDKLAWEFAPMVGGVFGDTKGVAPGYKGSLSWWKLELYSEGEYVFDASDSSESFFYCWNELTLSPVDWFRFGLVSQRTKVYETDRDIQRGFLVGLSYREWSLTTYVFNPDESKPTIVVGATFSF